MSPILCNGFDWQLVLTKWSLLHNGDSCQRSCRRALDNATDSTYRRGGNWIHFHYNKAEQNRLSCVTEIVAIVHSQKHKPTFDLLVVSTSVFLSFCTRCCWRLCSNCCHSDSWDLVDDLYRLHHRSGATGCGYDGWCRHGIGYRLHGCLRNGTMHSYQHWLAVKGGAYNHIQNENILLECIFLFSKFVHAVCSTLRSFTFFDRT